MNPPASCLVVVPMKDPADSKTRLSGAMTPDARRRLSQLLFQRTLQVLQDARRMWNGFDIAVVTASPIAADMARAANIHVIAEEAPSSLSKALDYAAGWTVAQGYQSLAVFPADLAAPDSREICRFLRKGAQTGQPVICPSTDMGTNAIMLTPPDTIPFAYGVQSAIRHRLALERAGQTPILMPLESLRFDIDTTACLEQAVRECPEIARLQAGRA